jgi:hypothetical protein
VKTNKLDETQEEREMVLLKSVTSEEVKLRKINLEEVSIIQGVFKKRPYFLNSSPTSREGPLRLLSTPSGRF